MAHNYRDRSSITYLGVIAEHNRDRNAANGCKPRSRNLPEKGNKTNEQEVKNVTVRIRTQEFLRSGVRMYRVQSIRGVLTKDKLDPIYVGTAPSFWITQTRKTIKMHDGATISVNGEYKSAVLLKLLREIALAGDRLHKINNLKRLAAEEKAKQTAAAAVARIAEARKKVIKTRSDAVVNDVPTRVCVFRI